MITASGVGSFLRRHWFSGGVLAALAASCILRFFMLGFFEFKSEQLMIMLNGLDMPGKYFLINHGMLTSVGIPNGPGIYQLAGLFALFGCQTPTGYAAATVGCSLAAVATLGLLLRRRVSAAAAWNSALLLGCIPIALVLSTNLWPPNFLPLFMVGIWALASRAQEKSQPLYWSGAVLLATATAMIHFSGFFLMPGLFWLFRRQRHPGKYFFLTGLAGAVLLAPWLWYLISEWNFQRFPDPSGGGRKTLLMLWEYATGFGGGFLQEYYGFAALTEPLQGTFGVIGGWSLLLLATLLPWIGAGRTLWALYRRENVPETIKIALILLVSILGTYALLRVHVYYFYLFLPFPLLAAVAGYGWSLLARPLLRQGLPLLWATAALLLAGTMLADIERAGGHPREYGIHYGWWQDLRAELAELRRVGGDFQLQLRFTARGGGRVDAGTLGYLFGDYFKPAPRRLAVVIDFDPVRRIYTRTWYPLPATPR